MLNPLDYLQKLLDYFKKGEKIVKIESLEAHRDVISKIDSPDLKDSEIVKEFENSTVTVNKTENNITNYFIVPKDSEELKKIIEILKVEKDKSDGTKVNILPSEDKVDYLDFKHDEKPLDKKYEGVLNRLNERHKALLALAIDIIGLYKRGESEVADATKRSVAEKYGDYGLKFCNLWTQGYLSNIFSLLAEGISGSEADKTNVDNAISSFINEAASIEFIHQHSDVAKIAKEVNGLLSERKDYVAIHSLGSATKIAREIVSKIKEVDSEYKAVLKDSTKKYSKIWYKGAHGSQVYSLVEKLL